MRGAPFGCGIYTNLQFSRTAQQITGVRHILSTHLGNFFLRQHACTMSSMLEAQVIRREAKPISTIRLACAQSSPRRESGSAPLTLLTTTDEAR